MTRVAVVTGGAAGTGLAVVERLANDGELVVALDRDIEALAGLERRSAHARWNVVPVAEQRLGRPLDGRTCRPAPGPVMVVPSWP